ncbi:MAG TPA: transposase, partial [Allosphingosinicella sp.]
MMDTDRIWIGLDLGEQWTNVCVLNDAGEVLAEQQCPTQFSDVESALSPFPIPQIALISVEAGTGTHLVPGLTKAGYPVRIFESRKASKFLAIRRNKTDSSDAKGLADIGRLDQNA